MEAYNYGSVSLLIDDIKLQYGILIKFYIIEWNIVNSRYSYN